MPFISSPGNGATYYARTTNLPRGTQNSDVDQPLIGAATYDDVPDPPTVPTNVRPPKNNVENTNIWTAGDTYGHS